MTNNVLDMKFNSGSIYKAVENAITLARRFNEAIEIASFEATPVTISFDFNGRSISVTATDNAEEVFSRYFASH